MMLKYLKNQVVEYIQLDNNLLEEPALDYIISFKKYNSSIKRIDMRGNFINRNQNSVI